MPIQVKEKVRNRTAHASLDWDGEKLEIDFNRAAYTPRLEEEAGKWITSEVAKNPSRYYAVMLSRIVTGWDVMDGKHPYALTEEALADLPVEFLQHVMDGLQAQILPGEKKATNSGSF